MPSIQETYASWNRQKQDDLIRDHLPMVYSTARRVMSATASGSLDIGDLVNSGVLALYRALDKYDERKGVPFGAYASHYVRGAMLDEVSRHRQVPRGLRDKQNKLNAAFDAVSQRLFREPTDEELAYYLDIGRDELNQWLVDLGWTTAFSLEELEETGSLNAIDPSEESSPELSIDLKENKALLAQALQRLSQKEQQVLWAYYEEELTLKEIAYVMELSESQVSRIRSKAVSRLRGMLSRQKGDVHPS